MNIFSPIHFTASQPVHHAKINPKQGIQQNQSDVFFSAHQSSYPKPSQDDLQKLFTITRMEWPKKHLNRHITRQPYGKHPRTLLINRAIGVSLGLCNPENSGRNLQRILTDMLNEADADTIASLLDGDLSASKNEGPNDYNQQVADALKLKVYKYGLPQILNLKTPEDYFWFLKTAQLNEGLALVEADLQQLIEKNPKKNGVGKLKSGQW